ncbi:MarR family winged helix-turn-helix transcriptional regulator [Variovorax sp. J22P271]|uniref:MarR family winged helix-turn-helix transcriptional regulator n=1 Tax=Variovorax davisae TaxID=3053515 RepID=UPI002576E792|nr:MarR family winged helix-turn-helix transcriptional regulator [Variovorax sp. J22P271]MDM0037226.1 MarR family winged helix-turn-helix transcriptional regulator [Variovorax sp. J22P271]
MPRTNTLPATKSARQSDRSVRAREVINLDNYAPAYFTWIANKLSSGASQAYLAAFEVGIESWRVLVLLAIEGSISAQKACGIIGMDKASMSRCFKSMQARGFIELALDPQDGRARIATLTPMGRKMHDQIRDIAIARERAFLSVLTAAERKVLLDLLRRLHENLPAVEIATRDHLGRHHPHALQRKKNTEPRSLS